MSRQERDIFELMQKLLQQHGKPLPSHDLKILLKWTALNDLLGVSQSTIFTTDLWDEVRMKLWNAIAKGDKVVADMLPSWRVVFEVLKAKKNPMLKIRGMLRAPPTSTAEA
ncbi:hypothetical protein Nmel_001263 [Mimus melanotis]